MKISINRTIGMTLTSLCFNIHPVGADDAVTFKPYGFIHADVIGASQAVDSFGNTNLSAPTAVSPSSVANSARARDSFQVAQSRLGTYIEYGKAVGHFELDFIDFTKASPTTQTNPRLRIANIDYKIDPQQTLSFGQDWDLFASPSKPITYNIVGLYFRAGNVGFMRQQIRYRYKTESDWTMGAALGLVNKNSTSTDSEIEMTGLPTASFLVSHRFHHDVEAGLTGIVGAVRPANFPADTATIYGINSYLNWETESGFKLHESLYYGMNLGSAGALSLANASTSGSRHEVGGYINAIYPLSESFSIQGGFGAAQVAEASGSPIDSLVGNAILSNWKLETALTYRPEKHLSLYLQPSYLQTNYLQLASNNTDTVSAVILQAGCLFQF